MVWVGLGLVALSWAAIGLSVVVAVEGVRGALAVTPPQPVPAPANPLPLWVRVSGGLGASGLVCGPPLGAAAGLAWSALLLRRHPERSPAAAAIAVGAALPLVAQIVAGTLLLR